MYGNQLFPNIRAVIEQATRELESQHESTPATPGVAERISYIQQLEVDWRCDSRLLEPAIFVSFSGDEGLVLYRQALTVIHGTRATPVGPSFKPKSGMQKEGAPEVSEHVLSRMKPCFGFLGILTAEMKLTSGAGVPGPWVQIEAGMAMAYGLRCVLMIENGVHQDFWRKPFGHLRHVAFDRPVFKARVTDALTIFQEHYRIDARK